MSERECRGRAQTLPLAMVVLILAVQTTNRCRFSSTPQAEAIATSATTVQCLHALLGAVVVSGGVAALQGCVAALRAAHIVHDMGGGVGGALNTGTASGLGVSREARAGGGGASDRGEWWHARHQHAWRRQPTKQTARAWQQRAV